MNIIEFKNSVDKDMIFIDDLLKQYHSSSENEKNSILNVVLEAISNASCKVQNSLCEVKNLKISLYERAESEREVIEYLKGFEQQEEILENAQQFLEKSKNYLEDALKETIETVFSAIIEPNKELEEQKYPLKEGVVSIGLAALGAFGALYFSTFNRSVGAGLSIAAVALGTIFYRSLQGEKEKVEFISLEQIEIPYFDREFKNLDEIKNELLLLGFVFEKMTKPLFAQRLDGKELFERASISYLEMGIKINTYRNSLLEKKRTEILGGMLLNENNKKSIEQMENSILEEFRSLSVPVLKLQTKARECLFRKEEFFK